MRAKADDKKVEEADAWFEYLEETQLLDGPRYREAETWAWARLQGRLGRLRPNRGLKKVRSVA